MKILFIGDIVAAPGREIVKKVLPEIKKKHSVDLVLANAENITHGRGATEEVIWDMNSCGIDYFTGGDHIFWHKGFDEVIDALPVIRPANYPGNVPGEGHTLIDLGKQGTVLLVNLMGRTFLNERLDNPFTVADEILEIYKNSNITATIVDFHAEATSEKYALGSYLDGRVDAVLGTHTHVPTCDNMVLPHGTMFISDVGMTGIVDAVLGVKKDIIIDLYLTARNQKFEWEDTGRKAFRSVILDMGNKTIERIDVF